MKPFITNYKSMKKTRTDQNENKLFQNEDCNSMSTKFTKTNFFNNAGEVILNAKYFIFYFNFRMKILMKNQI
jgi:hypothetical protein